MPSQRRPTRKTAKVSRETPGSGKKPSRPPKRSKKKKSPAQGAKLGWRHIKRAFGNIYAMADRPTHSNWNYSKFDRLKADLGKNDIHSAVYLLAAYCFDLHLRMAYLVEALSEIGDLHADTTFKDRVLDELAHINGHGPRSGKPEESWHDIAQRAHDTMQATHDRLQTKRGPLLPTL